MDKSQIYRLTEELATHLPRQLTLIVHHYIQASKEIDMIRDPHPKFGCWWFQQQLVAEGWIDFCDQIFNVVHKRR